MSKDTDVFVISPNRQTFYFPEKCLEIEYVLKYDSLEACKGIWLARAALKITKIQIFKFREVKCSSVWRYDKNIRFFLQKRTFKMVSDLVSLSKPFHKAVAVQLNRGW